MTSLTPSLASAWGSSAARRSAGFRAAHHHAALWRFQSRGTEICVGAQHAGGSWVGPVAPRANGVPHVQALLPLPGSDDEQDRHRMQSRVRQDTIYLAPVRRASGDPIHGRRGCRAPCERNEPGVSKPCVGKLVSSTALSKRTIPELPGTCQVENRAKHDRTSRRA
jgi:hypothetical protein